jgi:signal transduction histidine kinase
MQNWLAFMGLFILYAMTTFDILLRNLDFVVTYLRIPDHMELNKTVGMIFFTFYYAIVLALDQAETERNAVELRVKEQTLAADNTALDRFNRMREDLIAIVFHETMTPLAVLSGYAELVAMELRKQGVSGQTAKDLDNISAETMRIAGLLDALGSHYREQDKRLLKARFKLAGLINGAVRLYTPILQRKGTTLAFVALGDLPDVYAVPSEVTQVLFNLLQNARNHTENGEVKINAMANDSRITVTVSDTGSGVPPELLPHVFERGVSSGGGGVGLAVCRKIIEEHDGTIDIESEPGKGTTVWFTLQVWNESNPQ